MNKHKVGKQTSRVGPSKSAPVLKSPVKTNHQKHIPLSQQESVQSLQSKEKGHPDVLPPPPPPPQGQHEELGAEETDTEESLDQLPNVDLRGPVQAGLSVLEKVTALYMIEGVEMFDSRQKYGIYDPNGRQIFFARQNYDCCSSNNFNMTLVDPHGGPVMQVLEPNTCFSSDIIKVFSPPGTLIGKISRKISYMVPKFDIMDDNGNFNYRIQGPLITTSFGSHVEFKLLTCDGEIQVGRIAKQWGEMETELFRHTDDFGKTWPKETNANMKAVILGACIFINLKYYSN